jgi:hypothetical protein
LQVFLLSSLKNQKRFHLYEHIILDFSMFAYTKFRRRIVLSFPENGIFEDWSNHSLEAIRKGFSQPIRMQTPASYRNQTVYIRSESSVFIMFDYPLDKLGAGLRQAQGGAACLTSLAKLSASTNFTLFG